eukprot:scaffold69224_cov69-Phaeocystis_antarctica.AAC.2
MTGRKPRVEVRSGAKSHAPRLPSKVYCSGQSRLGGPASPLAPPLIPPALPEQAAHVERGGESRRFTASG